MFKFFLLFFLLIFMIGCNSEPVISKYSAEKYPNSILVKLSNESGISLETIGRNIWSIIEIEIIFEKFTKAEVQNFINKTRQDMNTSTYLLISRFVDKQYLKLTSNEDQRISQAAIIGFVLLKNRFKIPNFDQLILAEDKQILNDLFTYIETQLKNIPE